MRLVLAFLPPVVRGDLAVDTEHHRRILGRHGDIPQRPGATLHVDL
jgi:hypothetical protein